MKKFWKWFIDWWNEMDPLQEAILADYDNWIKEKQKTKQKMTKYRIVETYRYCTPNFLNPSYIIEKFIPANFGLEVDRWEIVTLDINMKWIYNNFEEAVKYLEKIEKLQEDCKKGDKVLLEKEI